MYRISQLYVYPVKSMGGIALQQAKLTKTGFSFDRFWMLVDVQGKFISQRELPELALFKLSMTNENISISYQTDTITIEKNKKGTNTMYCEIWEEQVEAIKEEDTVSQWFSAKLNRDVFLVRKADTERPVTNHPDAVINFSDDHQYLIFGENSLSYLNEKLPESLPVNRFRPNIVFTGGQEHIEDNWQEIQIGDTRFAITKACGRCKITTIDQATATPGKEPLQTLATYRQVGNKVLFGQYLKLLESKTHLLKLGDSLTVLREK